MRWVVGLAVAGIGVAGAEPVAVQGTLLASAKEAHCLNPQVSPDGAWVAYEVNASKERRDQYLAPTGAGEPRLVAPKPDRKELLRRLNKKQPSACHELAWVGGAKSPFVLSCSAGGRFQLFHASHVEQVPALIAEGGPAPARVNDFRPDVAAGLVAFVSDRSGQGDLYVRALDGSSQRRLTATAADAEFSPAWRPGGAGLVYGVHQAEGAGDDLFYVAAGGGAPVQLTRSPGTEFQPRWSPSGDHVAYLVTTSKDTPTELRVMRLVGAGKPSEDKLVTRGVVPGDRLGFAWTPDGAGLLYVRHKDPENPLEIMWLDRPDAPVTLATGTLQNSDPSVAKNPNGDWLLVWAAQARKEDAEKRWTRIYRATIKPATLR